MTCETQQCDHCDEWCHRFPSGISGIITVCTQCRPGESAQDCEARFNAAVAAQQAAFPPNC